MLHKFISMKSACLLKNLKKYLKTLPGGHFLVKPYQYLILLVTDPHALWLRAKKSYTWRVASRRNKFEHIEAKVDSQNLATILQGKIDRISFGKRHMEGGDAS